MKIIKSVSAAAFGGEVSVIPWANYESADWGKYSVTLDAVRSMANEELTIIVKGIEGDFMIDHILLTSSLNTEGCRSSIDLEYTPGKLKHRQSADYFIQQNFRYKGSDFQKSKFSRFDLCNYRRHSFFIYILNDYKLIIHIRLSTLNLIRKRSVAQQNVL